MFSRMMSVSACLLSCLLLSRSAFAVALGNPQLSQIDFQSQPGETQIWLHTGQQEVPVRTVLSADNKLILELSHIKSPQTVRTNFAEAENISHVILQPQSADTLRLIIRGKDLGIPAVHFVNTVTTRNETPQTAAVAGTSSSAAAAETALSLPSVEESPDVLVKAPLQSSLQPLTAASAASRPQPTIITDDAASLASNALDSGSANPASGATAEGQSLETLRPLTDLPESAVFGGNNIVSPENPAQPTGLTGNTTANTTTTSNPAASGLFEAFGLPGFLPDVLKWLVALGILGGLGWFLRKRLQALSDASHGGDYGADLQLQWLAQGHKKGRSPKPYQPDSYESPIGLGALRASDDGDRPHALPRQNTSGIPRHANPLPARNQARPAFSPPTPSSPAPAAITQPVLQPPVAKQAVLNQYQKAMPTPSFVAPTVAPAPRQPQKAAFPQLSRQEAQASTQRAKQERQAAQQAKAASPKLSANRPQTTAAATATTRPAAKSTQNPAISGSNPQVMDFLRSVAELMEQDGRPALSQSLQRHNPERSPQQPLPRR